LRRRRSSDGRRFARPPAPCPRSRREVGHLDAGGGARGDAVRDGLPHQRAHLADRASRDPSRPRRPGEPGRGRARRAGAPPGPGHARAPGEGGPPPPGSPKHGTGEAGGGSGADPRGARRIGCVGAGRGAGGAPPGGTGLSELRYETAGVLGTGLVAALFATTRLRREGAEHFERFRASGTPIVFVFWHGQLLPLVHYHRRQGIVVLVSEHVDGEYITRVIRRNGFGAVRGSSTRGGTKGLKALVRAARAGHDLALTPDGPRGPHGVFKAGAL